MIAVRRDVVAATGGQQRPWEQGSLVERFEFVADGTAAPAAEARPPAVEVAAAERSVGEAGAVEDFVRNRYLAPDANDIAGMVMGLYAPAPTIFGTRWSVTLRPPPKPAGSRSGRRGRWSSNREASPSRHAAKAAPRRAS
jgi:hypothetical protein